MLGDQSLIGCHDRLASLKGRFNRGSGDAFRPANQLDENIYVIRFG